jgi:hypothetical protein
MSRTVSQPLSLPTKLELALRVWLTFFAVRLRVHREPLPQLVARLRKSASASRRYPPSTLSRAVHKALRIGRRGPTCMVRGLVLYHLLWRQGSQAELVIGLPANPSNQAAHAWVELDGVDFGPPPGRADHRVMARFG